MRRVWCFVVVGVCAAIACVGDVTGRVSAAEPQKAVHVTLIGDSYSAGNGAGDYFGADGAYRSPHNWASIYVDWLKSKKISATLDNQAYSGYTTSKIIQDISKVSPTTDLIMLTAGGNDVHFADIVKQCFAVGFRDSFSCKEKVESAHTELGNVSTGITNIFEALERRLTASAQVVLVGYPLLATDGKYQLFDCKGSSFGIATHCESYDAGAQIRRLGTEATALQQATVERWNSSHRLKVHYVSAQTAFDGHEPDGRATMRNDYRWVNEFLETRGRRGDDGKTSSDFSWDSNEYYHPNLIGHEQVAKLIQQKVGIPSNTRTITPTGEGIDIVFVIDTTGSMGGYIETVKGNVRSIIDKTLAQSSSARFALVTYRDNPDRTGDVNDYASRLDLDFTSDGDALKSALATLSAGGGWDMPETVYSGVMRATQLNWRTGLRKVAIVLGDAPPLDPEPFTGYTASSVAAVAYAVDPVEIYGVDVGLLASREFTELVTASGGAIYQANGGNVADSFVTALQSSLSKPFAWLQGPYIGRVGSTLTLDARASYSMDSEIVRYEWDFDGDGTYDAITADPMVAHRFMTEALGVVGVRVTDARGLQGVGTTSIMISDDGDTTPRSVDNCPDVANYGQGDYDQDGVGDACDPDPGYPTTDKSGVYDSGTLPRHEAPKESMLATPTQPAVAKSVNAPVVLGLGTDGSNTVGTTHPLTGSRQEVVAPKASSPLVGAATGVAATQESQTNPLLLAALATVGVASLAVAVWRRGRINR